MEVIPALMTYNMDREKQISEYSGAPSMLDQYPDYGTGIGSNRNPLAPSTENPFQIPRGGWPVQYSDMLAVDTEAFGPATAGTAKPHVPTALFTSIEPFFMTPFEQYGESPGFFGVQTLTINLQFTPNSLQRVWSHAYGGETKNVAAPFNAKWASVEVMIAKAPRLFFRYVTPSPIKVMPSVMEYTYSQLNIYITAASPATGTPPPVNGVTPTSAQGNPVKSNSIQFNTIPDQIFVYLARQSQDRDFSTSDTFAVINAVSVDFMNQTGTLLWHTRTMANGLGVTISNILLCLV
jgi:hypothetical protein